MLIAILLALQVSTPGLAGCGRGNGARLRGPRDPYGSRRGDGWHRRSNRRGNERRLAVRILSGFCQIIPEGTLVRVTDSITTGKVIAVELYNADGEWWGFTQSIFRWCSLWPCED